MKKVSKLFVVLAAICFATSTYAEELGLKMANLNLYSSSAKSKKSSSGGGGAAHKGMIVLQPDFNLGSHYAFNRYDYGYYYGYGYYGFVPGFTFNVDFGVHDYVSVGPFVGMGGRNGYMNIAVGARGVFHWWQLLDDKVGADLKSDKIDFYFPVHLGVMIDRWKGFYDAKGKQWHAGAIGGAGLGFRYYIVKQFGVNLEWGWMEMSWAKIGLTVNLN